MAEQNMLPKRLVKLSNQETPICAACMFGKATHTPWRGKTTSLQIKLISIPGKCISFDTFKSTMKGFHCPSEGEPNESEIHGSNSIRQSLLRPFFCLHAKGPDQ